MTEPIRKSQIFGHLTGGLKKVLSLGCAPYFSENENSNTRLTNALTIFCMISGLAIYGPLQSFGLPIKYVYPYFGFTFLVSFALVFNYFEKLIIARVILLGCGLGAAAYGGVIFGKSFNSHYVFFITLIYSIIAFSKQPLWLRLACLGASVFGLPLTDYFHYHDILPITNLNSKNLPLQILMSDSIAVTAWVIAVIWLEKKHSNQYEDKLLKALEDIKKLSYIDPLTSIFNRRKFNEYYNVEFERAAELKQPLSLMLIDIDHFKEYNDRFGHIQGDECLKKVAETLFRNARNPKDLVARFGGEEFIIVLPGLSEKDTAAAAEVLRRAINRLEIPHPDKNAETFLSVSIGVCGNESSPGGNSHQLLSLADEALYEAKHRGRNQVVAYSEMKKAA